MNDQIKAPDTLLPTLMKRIKLAETSSDLLHSPHWQDRVNALHSLTSMDGIESLLTALNDTDESVRVTAIQLLSRREETMPTQRFIELLQLDPSSLVREAALVALRERSAVDTWQYLSNAQYDPSEIVSMAALVAMQGAEKEPEIEEQRDESVTKLAPTQLGLVAGQSFPQFFLLPQSNKKRRIITIISGLAATLLLLSTVSIFFVMKQPDNATPGPVLSLERLEWQQTFSKKQDFSQVHQSYWSEDSSEYFFASEIDRLGIFNTQTQKVEKDSAKKAIEIKKDNTIIMRGYGDRSKYAVIQIDDMTKLTQTLTIWDVATQQKVLEYEYESKLDGPNAVHRSQPIWWSNDEKHVATFDSGKIVLWNITNPTVYHSINTNHEEIRSVVWSKDKQYIAVKVEDNQLEVWDVAVDKRVLSKLIEVPVSSMVFSKDRHWLAVSSDLYTYVINVRTNEIVRKVESGNGSIILAWSVDNQYLVTQGYKEDQYYVKIWAIPTGRLVQTIPILNSTPSIVSPNDLYLAVSTPDNKMQIREIKTGKLMMTSSETAISPVHYWSPNSKYVAQQMQDKTVGIWDVNKGELVVQLNNVVDPVSSIHWSPDMKHIAVWSYQEVDQSDKANNNNGTRLINSTIMIWKLAYH